MQKNIVSFLLSAFFFFYLSNMCHGAIYYIDFDNGADNNTGASRDSAWKTIPGTRNTSDSGWEQTAWGNPTVFRSSNKVPAGTVFKLKGGTTHNNNNGGQVCMDSTYYTTSATGGNPIRFELDLGWGSGSVTFDGTGIAVGGSGGGFIEINVSGIEFDGKVNNGIVVQDSRYNGICTKWNSSELTDISFKYIKFYNNGESLTSDGAGAAHGQIFLYHVNGGSVENCEFDGGGNIICGFNSAGGNARIRNYTVSNCIVYNHSDDGSGYKDAGIGFKSQNSQVTFLNCASYNNCKGFDLGEYDINNTWDINYKVINCTAYNNDFGIGMSSKIESHAGTMNFYVINCIVRDNRQYGVWCYGGPANYYVVHSVLDNNGNGGKHFNLGLRPNEDSGGADPDPYEIHGYLYNSIFYKPNASIADGANYICAYWDMNFSDFSLDSDYNSWIQTGGEPFCKWGWWGGGSPKLYSYGTDGPGHGFGSDWYDDYGNNTTLPSNGCTGHYHGDEHSYATGGSDNTAPPFADIVGHDYTLTEGYPGTDLSSKPWYIDEMGTDRAGNVRGADVGWDVGAYGFTSGPRAPVSAISAVPTSGEAPLTVGFDGSGSYDPDGSIVSYEWDFENDGTVDAAGTSVQHTYTEIDVYTAKLTVTDNDGMTGSSTISINVYGQNSPPSFNPPLTDKTGEEGVLLQFNISAVDDDGDLLTFTQPENLPEGAIFVDNGDRTAAFSWKPWYDQAGNHQVTFTVTDGKDPVSGTINIQISETSNPPDYMEDFEAGLVNWQTRNFAGGNWEIADDSANGGDATALRINKPDDLSYNNQNQLASDATWTISEFSNFTLELLVRTNDSSEWRDLAVAFCYNADANTGYLALFNQNVISGTNSIFRLEGDSRVQIGPESVAGVLTDEIYHLVKITREGANISVYWDEELLFSASDATYSSGNIAVGSMNDSAIFDKMALWAASVQTHILTVTAVNGSVSKNPDQASYTHGTVVSLSAIPDSGYSFLNWSGNLSGSDNPTALTMDADKSITANFYLIPPPGPPGRPAHVDD